MIDRRLLTDSTDRLRTALGRRKATEPDVESLVALAEARKEAIGNFEALRAEQNRRQQEMKTVKKGSDEFRALIGGLKDLSERVKLADADRKAAEETLDELLLLVPNLPADDAPDGKDESANVVIKTVGETTAGHGEDHVDIGERLGLLDFGQASKVAGARFAVLKGAGARLERALIQFMLDVHADQHGYTEVMPPFMVNRAAMTGTGQLPKFEDDAFCIEAVDMFLVPTAEVPVTNLHAGDILDGRDLPIRYAAFTPCFRREAGSYGKDTRGLIRMHQFNKVELVWFTPPDASAEAHASLISHAEKILELLELPYRNVDLCAGDLGFGAARCTDIEVWFPSQDKYREISSCSNYKDFQARRANIRFRAEPGDKPKFVHTLNGSALAIGRTFAAILENYAQGDGSVRVPAVLRPYMGGAEDI